MSNPSAAQLAWARRLLAAEGNSGADTEVCVAAAVRVYDKVAGQLTPLLGLTGVESLFRRCAKLASAEYPALGEVAAIDGPTELATRFRACAASLDPTVASEAAAVLFGTFLDLIVTFIGDRLTDQVLRGAWPSMEATAPRETQK
jgi:hypothetical protein